MKKIRKNIRPEKDIDGTLGENSEFYPATPLGIINYLKACKFDFIGKDIVIIGRSKLVGAPLARMLTDLDCTVTLCHSKTKNLMDKVKRADLVVCAVGKKNFLNCADLNMPVIDVGINFNEVGKLCGDCYNTEGKMVTPVPGGVGLLTRSALLENCVNLKKVRMSEGLGIEENEKS